MTVQGKAAENVVAYRNVSESSHKARRLAEYAITRNEKNSFSRDELQSQAEEIWLHKTWIRRLSRQDAVTMLLLLLLQAIETRNTAISALLFGRARNEIEPRVRARKFGWHAFALPRHRGW